MPKSKFYKIAIVVLLIAAAYCLSLAKESLNYRENIKKYSALLEKDPKNCHYLDQIAISYQALNEHHNAISFFERVLNYCPENLLDRFQLGVCYYLLMERDTALVHMNKAIEMAENVGNEELKEMFLKEKASWLEKWETVKTMEWNKNKTNESK